MKVKTNIASNLKRLRGSIAQRVIAQYLHVKRNTYDAWEEGRSEPQLCYVIKLSKFYNITIEQLLTDNKQIEINPS